MNGTASYVSRHNGATMALTVYGLYGRPDDFAVTKVGAPLEECAFILDFTRPLEKFRWLGVHNKWIGVTVGLLVPVVHYAEQSGGFVIALRYGELYFVDIPRMWKEHRSVKRNPVASPAGG